VGEKILVVEDNELNLKLFCDLLRAHAYQAEPVRDGREAIARARAFSPDLIVMDIQMPHISGLELIEQLKADGPLKHVPIMAVTAYAAKGDEERIRAAGAEGYVSKPISVVRFVEAVRALLAAPRRAVAAPQAGRWDSADRAVQAAVESGIPGAVGLVRRGGDVHVHASGVRSLDAPEPMSRDTIFSIASLSKPVTAAAAMILVEDGVLGLDEPVDAWLPELAGRQVVRSLEGPLEDTVPAARPITLRDLLTMRMGLGATFSDPAPSPLLSRFDELGIAPGPALPKHSQDEYMRRLGSLPLAFQPGERWLYHTGIDVAGVLVARAAGTTLGDFLRRRLFEPLGMEDTGFFVPPEKQDRLAQVYARDAETGELKPHRGFDVSQPPPMEAGGGGLASTVDDFAVFGAMLLAGGKLGGERILSPATVAEMVRDQIPEEVKEVSPFFDGFWTSRGWGLGMAVATDADGIVSAPGGFGWAGGTGTRFMVDPATGTVAVFMSQRMMAGPNDTAAADAFLKAAVAAD
jgi:CubicO group peptidase (beta-lactamase class C family)